MSPQSSSAPNDNLEPGMAICEAIKHDLEIAINQGAMSEQFSAITSVGLFEASQNGHG
jgi:hypothetical protein